jgi:hypothetical protein
MEALLLGLWLFSLILSLGARRRREALVVVVPVVLVTRPEEAAPALQGEAWLRRRLDELAKDAAP